MQTCIIYGERIPNGETKTDAGIIPNIIFVKIKIEFAFSIDYYMHGEGYKIHVKRNFEILSIQKNLKLNVVHRIKSTLQI